jgi:hypothetical protein
MLETIFWVLLLTLFGFVLGVSVCALTVMYLLKSGEDQ